MFGVFCVTQLFGGVILGCHYVSYTLVVFGVLLCCCYVGRIGVVYFLTATIAFFVSESIKSAKKKCKFIFSAFLFLPSQYFFPAAATEAMSLIITFHHNIMFYLTFFTVFIF